MKVKYDSKVDAIYIEFAKGKYDKTRKISDAVWMRHKILKLLILKNQTLCKHLTN